MVYLRRMKNNHVEYFLNFQCKLESRRLRFWDHLFVILDSMKIYLKNSISNMKLHLNPSCCFSVKEINTQTFKSIILVGYITVRYQGKCDGKQTWPLDVWAIQRGTQLSSLCVSYTSIYSHNNCSLYCVLFVHILAVSAYGGVRYNIGLSK